MSGKSAFGAIKINEQRGYQIMGIKFFEFALGVESGDKFDYYEKSDQAVSKHLNKLEKLYFETYHKK